MSDLGDPSGANRRISLGNMGQRIARAPASARRHGRHGQQERPHRLGHLEARRGLSSATHSMIKIATA